MPPVAIPKAAISTFERPRPIRSPTRIRRRDHLERPPPHHPQNRHDTWDQGPGTRDHTLSFRPASRTTPSSPTKRLCDWHVGELGERRNFARLSRATRRSTHKGACWNSVQCPEGGTPASPLLREAFGPAPRPIGAAENVLTAVRRDRSEPSVSGHLASRSDFSLVMIHTYSNHLTKETTCQ